MDLAHGGKFPMLKLRVVLPQSRGNIITIIKTKSSYFINSHDPMLCGVSFFQEIKFEIFVTDFSMPHPIKTGDLSLKALKYLLHWIVKFKIFGIQNECGACYVFILLP